MFQRHDSLIYLSIASSRNPGVSLVDLISTADYIDHAIPTREEVEGAVNRFLRFGMLEVQQGIFYLTAVLKREYEVICSKNKSYMKQWERLYDLLQEQSFPVQQHEPYVLSEECFAHACNSYLKKS